MTADLPATPRAPGLRERKKQLTRDTLLRTALELFTGQGYEETTVDEIAERAGVSQRTYFRYFATKEEAAFAMLDLVESRFVAAVAARPPEEPPLHALRGAVLDTWDAAGEAVRAHVPVELHMRMCQLIERTPSLMATRLRHSADIEEALAQVIAEREGVDLATDPGPRVAVAAFGGVMRLTGRIWGAGDSASLDALHRITTTYLGELENVLGQECPPDTRTDGGRPDRKGAGTGAGTAAGAAT